MTRKIGLWDCSCTELQKSASAGAVQFSSVAAAAAVAVTNSSVVVVAHSDAPHCNYVLFLLSLTLSHLSSSSNIPISPPFVCISVDCTIELSEFNLLCFSFLVGSLPCPTPLVLIIC